MIRPAIVYTVLIVGLAAAIVVSTAVGAVPLPLADVLEAVGSGLRGGPRDPIIWELRLPRALLGALVGAALAVSGAAYQGLFRNALADPYLMGAASGAGFGATVALSLLGLGAAWVPVGAFLGALLAVGLALLVAGGVARTHDLVLAGVVVGAVLVGMTTWLMLYDQQRVLQVLAYTLGNLAVASWPAVGRMAVWCLLTLPPLMLSARALDALQLGEDVAQSLGLPMRGLKLALIAAATLATAVGVAEVGIVGFVGLVVPHTLRRLLGGAHHRLLPASALGGALLLILADLGARTVARPAELPVGVLTTLLGGPFFLGLLRRRRDR